MKSVCLTTLIFCLTLPQLFAVDKGDWVLGIQSHESLKEHKIQPIQSFDSEQKRSQYINDIVWRLRDKMFLEASIDSMWKGIRDTLWIQLHIGQQYDIQTTLPQIFTKGRKSTTIQNPTNIPSTLESIDALLDYWQNHGYPFAEVTWDTLQLQDGQLKMNAKIEKGPFITIDSIKNRDNGKISTSFLRSYLGIKKDIPYREKTLAESDALMKKLPFVRFARPSTVNFHGDKATMNVYLANRKVSKFDFLVGLLPNSEGTGKMLITGEANLQLQNAFKRGEEIYLQWKRVKANSQQLKVRFNYPYILQSPIGVNGTFSLDKRDTAFLDLNWTLGVPFRTKANNFIKAYIENTQTIVLSTDTLRIRQSGKLPSIQDVSALLYGFEGYFENLDYLFNPRRGIEVSANVQVGTRKIKKSNAVLKMGEEFEQLYDTVQLKSFQAQFQLMFQSYIRISNRSVVKLGLKGASRLNKGIMENELYRIGGANLLRGFDEESIFTQHYLVSTAEYRFILDHNSYFYTFADAAFVASKLEGKFNKDFPLGFGVGIAFETKAGIFGVSYAVGRQKNSPIDFRKSKLHFGYVNIF